MAKKRIQIYTDEQTKRRIELAAARREVAVTRYCFEAIEQQLAEDDMLERERIEIFTESGKDTAVIADLRALRERILARRGGQPIDIDIMTQIRQERDYELTGLY